MLLLGLGIFTVPANAQEAEVADPWLEKVAASLGTRFGDLTERVHIGDAEDNSPKSFWIVLETKGRGYDLITPSSNELVVGHRLEGAVREIVRVNRGDDPVKIARERYEKAAKVPDCLAPGVNAWNGVPDVFDVGPQVTILPFGPYENTNKLIEDSRAGKFELGPAWERVRDDNKEWEGWRCEE